MRFEAERRPAFTAAGLHLTGEGVAVHASVAGLGGGRVVAGRGFAAERTVALVHASGGRVSWYAWTGNDTPATAGWWRHGTVDVVSLLLGRERWTTRRVWWCPAEVIYGTQCVPCHVTVEDHERRRGPWLLGKVRHATIHVDPPGVHDRAGGRHLGFSGPLPALLAGEPAGSPEVVAWAAWQITSAVAAIDATFEDEAA